MVCLLLVFWFQSSLCRTAPAEFDNADLGAAVGSDPTESRRRLLPCAQAREHRREVFGTDVEVLAYAAPEHRRGDVAAAALLLGLVENVQDDSLLASQAVADIGQGVVRVTHRRILLQREVNL